MDDSKILNISIFSYNVYWKIMKLTNLDKLIQLKLNIIANILNTKNYYNPFIYCFQEAESAEDIINLFEHNKYKYHIGYSNPEHILTIWRTDVIKKKLVFDGEFEPGRPFSIFVFKDLRFKTYLMLINIHASHSPHTNSSLFHPIQKLIEKNKNDFAKYSIERVVIIGDFNRDISSQIAVEPIKFNLVINSIKFYFFGSKSNKNKTCCSIKGWGYKNNYDQLIDSYKNPSLTYQLNNESWYIPESSDHLAILSILENL
jgi:hypothetical protein